MTQDDDRSPADAGKAQLGRREFEALAEFIYGEVGIKLPEVKKTMLEARLQKRLRALGMRRFEDYCTLLFSDDGRESELKHCIDVVTTNTTDFFREPKHFEILVNQVIPHWKAMRKPGPFRIWSAGCSYGMEPYTLAMVLDDFAAKHPGFDFTILATDISTQALKGAVNAVYELDKIAPVPGYMKSKYLLKSKNKAAGLVRIVPELRARVEFARLNFMHDFALDHPMNVIFCRNVVIYFDRPTQERLFQKFCHKLAPGGNLFIGHSESITGMDLPLKQIAPTVYQKK